ncbi:MULTISPECIES: secondary thiamine-phosphate synthase enzyme YjbQ [Eubacteriales]|uniref:YjbQ family protein n=1 Tax=Bittarella massiliensis (ex Durand et al. 2017) TaxID=1720313 RepID=A0ABW9WQZ2_9FIRM|nr:MULTISPECIES: secondary thiamine-phosphate synthase enzyme YjbQ [Eubacteriales]ERI97848.1 secondary thiamine-phosphate synthase enzyme [Clostridium sp. ATCC 29733]MZL68295.1 YjbQ family protein [Bittarella massiliensis (ex Durand et al. 2017)]MZL79650.1 YjbQ family protein [Bittarella massiliensis (ex Durand et al. 2017)]
MDAVFETIELQTQHHKAYDITAQVKEIVERSGVKDGICTIFCPETTAGICIHSFWDPLGWDDMMDDIQRAFPATVDYRQRTPSAYTAAAATKASLMGGVQSLIVRDGALAFGSSQGILLAEFDGPSRCRRVCVNVME